VLWQNASLTNATAGSKAVYRRFFKPTLKLLFLFNLVRGSILSFTGFNGTNAQAVSLLAKQS